MQHLTLPPAWSEQLAQVDADRLVAALAQLRRQLGGGGRQHDVPTVGHGVEAKDDGIDRPRT